jgi:hypothetical protein
MRAMVSAPLLMARPYSPLTLLVHSSRDDMVPVLSERLTGRPEELSVPHLLVQLPWATHGFDFRRRRLLQ